MTGGTPVGGRNRRKSMGEGKWPNRRRESSGERREKEEGWVSGNGNLPG